MSGYLKPESFFFCFLKTKEYIFVIFFSFWPVTPQRRFYRHFVTFEVKVDKIFYKIAFVSKIFIS